MKVLWASQLAACVGITLILNCVVLGSSAAANSSGTRWIEYTESDGETIYLQDDRRPALYTQNFGDCLGGSLINVTRFDAAYYHDNMSVLFHLAGNSPLTNQSLMLYIGVFAYGQPRFDLTFNPCDANINSLCPLNSSVPIEASGIIPVAQSDVAGIPPIALTIPDFEGQAILRVFANSTESEIGCFSAVVTNGNTFSHPKAIGSLLGIFTAVACISSLLVAIYGEHVPETRKHYAHSLSVLVVFSVLHHIYFTGGLSMNWPSVLVAFWSNYAWSAGIIYWGAMQTTISQFIGSNGGNISMVGAMPAGETAFGLGGGYDISQIYKRSLARQFQTFEGTGSTLRSRPFEHALHARDLANASTGFSWYGRPVGPGLPLPGNYSGFAGTLAVENIPAANAFMTGLLWLLILISFVTSAMVLLRLLVEGLVRVRIVKSDRVCVYRRHWRTFTAAAVMRTCLIAFFMIMFLTMFQFTLGGGKPVRTVAGIVFCIFFIGLMCAGLLALFCHPRQSRQTSNSANSNPQYQSNNSTPWHIFRRGRMPGEKAGADPSSTAPWWRLCFAPKHEDVPHVHDDEKYLATFGWLSARFRRSKWWFFIFWLIYEFVRAAFFGGAAGHPLTQVFGLLAWETLALVAIIITKPFASSRLNVLMVYLLGFSKVATVALSSAFDIRFGLGRILTTAIGIGIIVIQGVLTICLMVAIVLGAISSYMSINRNRARIRPSSWNRPRERYFAHMDRKDVDHPGPPPPPPLPMPEIPAEPYFAVAAVRREPKIEDEEPSNPELEEDGEDGLAWDQDPVEMDFRAPSRTQSLRSHTSASNLPHGARRHRASWSTRDFDDLTEDSERDFPPLYARMSVESIRETPIRHRASSLRIPPRNGRPVAPCPEESDVPPEPQRPRRASTNPARKRPMSDSFANHNSMRSRSGAG